MEKQKLLFEQSRLCSRGAAEMVLMYISASSGNSFHCSFTFVLRAVVLAHVL